VSVSGVRVSSSEMGEIKRKIELEQSSGQMDDEMAS
jgi:hypothetical protein